MENKRKILPSYTLLEMLLVMGIVVVLGAFGVGGFVGVRETMVARENVELIKQDIRSARLKSMLLEKGSDENWLYGIGIDFGTILSYSDDNIDGYTFFKWCSPFEDFGNSQTKSVLPGWDPDTVIGTTDFNTGPIPYDPNPIIREPIPYDPIPYDPGDNYITPDPTEEMYFNIEEIFKKINFISPAPVIAIDDTLQEIYYERNGYISIRSTDSCIDGTHSRVNTGGDGTGGIIDVDDDQIRVLGNIRYLVFEALTGRAFLYYANGAPANYTGMAEYNADGVLDVLDVVLTRKRSSKFDVISVYPLSGTVIHHVYSNSDKVPSCLVGMECITFDGNIYKRYGIADEINSYRE